MTNNLFVGNLPYAVDEEALRGIFEGYGGVKSVKIIMDRDSGKSKGFGFVEMETEEGFESALKETDGMEVEGREMRVSKAKPRKTVQQ